MTEFGTEKTTTLSGGNQISDVVKYHKGMVSKKLRSYRVRVKVVTAQDEMTEYIRFTDEIAKLRLNNKLTIDEEDVDTYPAFLIQYPKHDFDRGYFIIKCWTEVV